MVNFAMTLVTSLPNVYNVYIHVYAGVEHVLILCSCIETLYYSEKNELFSKLLILMIMGPAFCIYIYLTFFISQSKAALSMLLVFSPYKVEYMYYKGFLH